MNRERHRRIIEAWATAGAIYLVTCYAIALTLRFLVVLFLIYYILPAVDINILGWHVPTR